MENKGITSNLVQLKQRLWYNYIELRSSFNSNLVQLKR